MKKIFIISSILLIFIGIKTSGQTNKHVDSIITFCGQKLKTDLDCFLMYEQIPTWIKCNDFIFTWQSIKKEDIDRIRKETIKQLTNPTRYDCKVLGVDALAYKEKQNDGFLLSIVGDFNENPVVITIYIFKDFNNNDDLPKFIRQFVDLKE